MSVLEICQWLQSTDLALAVREGYWGYLVPQIVHLASMALFGGAVVAGDMRILGGIRKPSFPVFFDQLVAIKWVGFWLTAISGMLLFMSDATRFYKNPSFLVKTVLLLVIALNAWIFRAGVYKNIAAWDAMKTVPRGAKIAAIVSLVLWIGVLAASRGIAFTLSDI